jgi:hypothetical protein
MDSTFTPDLAARLVLLRRVGGMRPWYSDELCRATRLQELHRCVRAVSDLVAARVLSAGTAAAPAVPGNVPRRPPGPQGGAGAPAPADLLRPLLRTAAREVTDELTSDTAAHLRGLGINRPKRDLPGLALALDPTCFAVHVSDPGAAFDVASARPRARLRPSAAVTPGGAAGRWTGPAAPGGESEVVAGSVDWRLTACIAVTAALVKALADEHARAYRALARSLAPRGWSRRASAEVADEIARACWRR